MPAACVRVWDPLVRIVHWGVACLVAIDLVNEAGANPWHRNLGYAAGGLVVLRLAWGFCGTPHARLAPLVRTAGRVVPYLAELRAHAKPAFSLGHNPLGALMALALWTLVLVVVVTGWMLRLDRYWGDDMLEAVHSVAAYVLAGCALLHVAGVVTTSLLYRVNLLKSMITGIKPFPQRDPPAAAREKS